ncbi:hypothetical protein Q7C36_003106 [Tachysurus vachellii]|uniref:Uncharacterized protein n=1 Tax=Tachysurus vachellii TaxID=175792 RepID=A0AA88T4P7_TACVA|nr:hypothetical protein Q7C36_003106 [Tachysurus vachellii]
MLFLLQILCCFLCVLCVTQGLQVWFCKDSRVISQKKKKDLSEKELHFITRILSIGLVDADPDILHHLKEYRDVYRIPA